MDKIRNFSSFLGSKFNDIKNSISAKLAGGSRLQKRVSDSVKSKAGFADLSYQVSPPNYLANYGDLVQNTDDLKVYHDKNNKKLNVSIRGTDLSSFSRATRDLPTDFKYILGMDLSSDKRYQDTNKAIKRLQEQYPDHEIKTYGFSLGGALAKQAVKDNPNIKAEIFNPLSSVFSDKEDLENVKAYRSSGDLLSIFNRSKEDYEYLPKNPLYPHGIANLQ